VITRLDRWVFYSGFPGIKQLNMDKSCNYKVNQILQSLCIIVNEDEEVKCLELKFTNAVL